MSEWGFLQTVVSDTIVKGLITTGDKKADDSARKKAVLSVIVRLAKGGLKAVQGKSLSIRQHLGISPNHWQSILGVLSGSDLKIIFDPAFSGTDVVGSTVIVPDCPIPLLPILAASWEGTTIRIFLVDQCVSSEGVHHAIFQQQFVPTLSTGYVAGFSDGDGRM